MIISFLISINMHSGTGKMMYILQIIIPDSVENLTVATVFFKYL